MSKEQKPAAMKITFWGTRGTLPAPGPQFAQAGGNTNCTELTIGEETIVFDAGTGVRELGSQLAAERPQQNVHLLLTHAHYDHVEGLPFFAPFFIPKTKVKVCCGKLDGSDTTKDTVLELMRRPYFPVGPSVFTADVEYVDLQENDAFSIGENIKISTMPLNHPGGATGYRVDCGDKSFACITDTEHVIGEHDQSIIDFIKDVDAFIYDCSLTDEEYPDFAGYGHSTFEEGLRLQELANAGQLIAFHHMPFRTDAELNKIEQDILQKENASNMIAREGFSFTL